jgi:hypothetical protein
MIPCDLPQFIEGRQFRQLHPTREGGKRWRYKTLRGIRLPVKGITEHTIVYHDATGKAWARHDRFGLYVEEGYAWNGCSPKRWVWPFGWMGTPDFKCTHLASLTHDVQYQFSRTDHFPLNRSEVDAMFRNTIELAGCDDIARIYYEAVRKFGSWSDKPKNGEFSTLL